ncbi:MAG: response regulator transcription factor [Hungatella sp.]
MKILIIEDEQILAASLQLLLQKKEFEVDISNDGETGLEYAELGIYDLIILDVMMPRMNGYEVARKIRDKRMGIPILMLTAKSQLEDRVDGLNSGADYYLTKPFDTKELLACINALLRRQGSQVDGISMGNTYLNLSTAMLTCGENSIRLSSREFDVMRYLFQSKGSNLSKEMILTKVWGYDSNAVENHVEVYIGFLRKKLLSIGSHVSIVAIRRLGYHLEVNDDD